MIGKNGMANGGEDDNSKRDNCGGCIIIPLKLIQYPKNRIFRQFLKYPLNSHMKLLKYPQLKIDMDYMTLHV